MIIKIAGSVHRIIGNVVWLKYTGRNGDTYKYWSGGLTVPG